MRARIVLRSRDRTSGSSSEFEFKQVDQILEGEYQVEWATIPNTLYNVSTTNNVLAVTSGTGSATLTPGNYTGATLAAEVQTQLTAVHASARTVTYSSISNKLTITAADASATVFGPATANDGARVVGVAPGTTTSVASGSECPYVVFLGSPLSLGIQISGASTRGYQTSNRKSGSILVPWIAATNVFNVLVGTDFSNCIEINEGQRIFNVRVVDPGTDEVVDLNGGEWEMILTPKGSTARAKRRRM